MWLSQEEYDLRTRVEGLKAETESAEKQNEELKAEAESIKKQKDEMEWVGRMNSIRNRVDEVVMEEIVYRI